MAGELFSAETLQLLRRISTQPDGQRQQLINSTINALVRTGIWAKLDFLYVMAAADAQSAKLNWLSSSYTLSPVNSPTFTADRGYRGNGTSSYLDTGFDPSVAGGQFTLNNSSMGVFVQADVTGAGTSVNMGNTENYIDAGTGGTMAGALGGGVGSGGNGGSPLGLTALSRNLGSAGNGHIYKNGASVTSLGAVSGLGDTTLLICARNSDTSLLYTTMRHSAAFAGANLTDQNQSDMYDILNTYMVAVGAV